MREFKHKKTGKTLQECELPLWVFEEGDDWEEIKEKNYKIMSFQCVEPSYVVIAENIEAKDIKSFISSKDWYILSVKRLSDGEVFTVGDNIVSGVSDKGNRIKAFNLVDNQLNIFHSDNFALNTLHPEIGLNCHLNLIHKAKPIFTTEDGVEVFVGDTVYLLSTTSWVITNLGLVPSTLKTHPFKGVKGEGFKYFSSLASACEYVKRNMKSLSLEDVFSIYPEFGKDGERTAHAKQLLEKLK